MIRVEGLAQVQANLKVYGLDIDKSIKKALKEAAQEVVQLSSAKVPVQTGNLRDSIYVKIDGDQVEIGYNANYATEVHERTERGHSSGQAKFLEQALNEFSGDFNELFVKHLQKAL